MSMTYFCKHTFSSTIRTIASYRMSWEEVKTAHARIRDHVHRTPVMTSSTVDDIVGRKVFFKCENFQKTGSFKARGALNAILKLKESNPGGVPAGTVTHSTGNHGQGVAWASRVAGLPCSVVVPNNTPQVKAEAIKGYGAQLTYCEPNPQSRLETCDKISKETGKVIIPPYDHYDVIAGQGTIALELHEQVPDLDAILVPVSGGGMSSGISIATKAIRPGCKVFAVEPEGKDLEPCLQTGERLWPNPAQFVDTIAEGLRSQQVGHITFPILVDLLEKQVFTVTNQQMVKAMQFSMERLKLVIEASSAAGISAVMSDQMKALDPSIHKVGVIVCGGNVDITKLPW